MSAAEDQARKARDIIARGIHRALGLHPRLATEAAAVAYEELREEYASDKLYFPNRDPFRQEKILADFTGDNHAEVCRKHRISQRTLERYLQVPG